MPPSTASHARALAAALALIAPRAAHADPDLDDRPRWEVAVGGDLAGLAPHPGDQATDLGYYLHAGARFGRRFAAFASYERDGLDEKFAGTRAYGAFDRAGLWGRVTVLTLGADPHGDMALVSSYFELFAEGGVGVQRVQWDGDGSAAHCDLAYGFAAKLLGIRISDHRALGLLFDLDGLAARSDGPISGARDYAAQGASAGPNQWSVGLRGSLSIVVTN